MNERLEGAIYFVGFILTLIFVYTAVIISG